jgi:hypothetical protein
MLTEALAAKEMLVKHGLSETVLESLIEALDEFDYQLEQGRGARLIHISASAGLDAVANEVVQIVRVMDGADRVRFAHQPELLIAWRSESCRCGAKGRAAHRLERETNR